MNNSTKIPIGTYVKIRTDLKPDCFNYGLYFNDDMKRQAGKICIVREVYTGNKYSREGDRQEDEIVCIKLISARDNSRMNWTWTPAMLEFPTNEEIGETR